MNAVVLGLLGGLATIGLSEFLIRVYGTCPLPRLWKVLLAGVFLRTLWVLGLLAGALASGIREAKSFTIALLSGYIVAQIFEGLRYQRLIRTR